ncbi:PspA/IM30 family protein [bacterium]|nr:PspA/IM30 family protein [bacterium]
MSVLQRMNMIIKSNLNDYLDRVENPVKMVKQLLMDMKVEYKNAEAVLTKAIVDEKRIEREYLENVKKAEKYEKKAFEAVENGDDELARAALKRKNGCQKLSCSLKEHLEEQQLEVGKIKIALKALKSKLAEAEERKLDLIKRAEKAKKKAKKEASDKKRVYEIDTSAFNDFERMEEKILDMETEAEVMEEMAEEFDENDEIEKELNRIGIDDEFDDELVELRKRLKKTDKTIDNELEAIKKKTKKAPAKKKPVAKKKPAPKKKAPTKKKTTKKKTKK